MSLSEPLSSTRNENNDRYRTTAEVPDVEVRETKPSPLTTEFWAMVVGVAALIVIYNVSADRSLNLFRASLLVTLFAVGYMVSRGLAKSGTGDTERSEAGRRG